MPFFFASLLQCHISAGEPSAEVSHRKHPMQNIVPMIDWSGVGSGFSTGGMLTSGSSLIGSGSGTVVCFGVSCVVFFFFLLWMLLKFRNPILSF